MIYCSLRISLSSGIHVTLCPLNVTEKLCFDPPFRLLLRESGSIGTFLVEAHDFMIKVILGIYLILIYFSLVIRWLRRLDILSILAWGECDEHNVPMHDVTAVLAMLFPDAFESKQVRFRISSRVIESRAHR